MEHASELLPSLIGALAAVLALLLTVVGWLFSRVWSMLGQIFGLLRTLENELRGDLSAMDRRLATLEGRCNACYLRGKT